jgi:hypothetical protein
MARLTDFHRQQIYNGRGAQAPPVPPAPDDQEVDQGWDE